MLVRLSLAGRGAVFYFWTGFAKGGDGDALPVQMHLINEGQFNGLFGVSSYMERVVPPFYFFKKARRNESNK